MEASLKEFINVSNGKEIQVTWVPNKDVATFIRVSKTDFISHLRELKPLQIIFTIHKELNTIYVDELQF